MNFLPLNAFIKERCFRLCERSRDGKATNTPSRNYYLVCGVCWNTFDLMCYTYSCGSRFSNFNASAVLWHLIILFIRFCNGIWFTFLLLYNVIRPQELCWEMFTISTNCSYVDLFFPANSLFLPIYVCFGFVIVCLSQKNCLSSLSVVCELRLDAIIRCQRWSTCSALGSRLSALSPCMRA